MGTCSFMKIGILGCGYVGKGFAHLMKEQGHTVSVTTRQPSRLPELQAIADQVQLIQASEELEKWIQQQEILLIAVAPSRQDSYYDTYLKTAEHVARSTSKPSTLQQIIYTSSVSVYGEHGGHLVTEETPVQPSNDNSRILVETEQLLLQIQNTHLKTCIFRLGEIYGPGREIKDRLRRFNGYSLPGTGENYTNLNSLETILSGLSFAMQKKLDGIYNLCEDLHIPRKDFYDALCKQENIKPIKWDPLVKSPHGGNKQVDSSRIKSLGFKFSSSILL